MRRRAKQQNSLRLGIFAVSAIALLYVFVLVFMHFQGVRGYRIGVRFATVSGLSPGAPVYVSGVQIGAVEKIEVLPDNSVEVILAITRDIDLPTTSRITIHSPLTGSPDVTIIPPITRVAAGSIPAPLPPNLIIPKRVLPLDEQPIGRPPISPKELIAQSQELLDQSGHIVGMFLGRRRTLLAQVDSIRDNSAGLATDLRSLPQTLRANLAGTLNDAKAEVSRTQALVMNSRNQAVLAQLSASLNAASASLEQTSNALNGVRTDRATLANTAAAMNNVKQASATMHAARIDFQTIGANPQTRAELLDAGVQLRASVERLRSLIIP